MSFRVQRVSEEIQKVISQRLIRGLRNPLPGFVSVSSVEVTSDFSQAKIFVSVFGSAEDKQGAMRVLEQNRGFLRHELAQQIRLRHTPDLVFILDESAERGARVMHLIAEEEKELAPP